VLKTDNPVQHGGIKFPKNIFTGQPIDLRRGLILVNQILQERLILSAGKATGKKLCNWNSKYRWC
jgi:hypothetical protein